MFLITFFDSAKIYFKVLRNPDTLCSVRRMAVSDALTMHCNSSN